MTKSTYREDIGRGRDLGAAKDDTRLEMQQDLSKPNKYGTMQGPTRSLRIQNSCSQKIWKLLGSGQHP